MVVSTTKERKKIMPIRIYVNDGRIGIRSYAKTEKEFILELGYKIGELSKTLYKENPAYLISECIPLAMEICMKYRQEDCVEAGDMNGKQI